MKLSIESLKLQFKQYLIEQGIEPELNKNDEFSGVSIFTHESEFKDFIEENFKINIDDLSFNIEDLLEMDMEDGQFVMPEDENEDEVTQDELLLTLLNTLLEDEEFTKNLDETGDGKLDSDEIKKFLTYSNEQDEDDEILTFADIAKGTTDVKNGDYKPSDDDLDTNTETSNIQSSSSRGGSYSSSSSSSSSSSTTPNQEETEKDFSKMTIAELEEKRTEQTAAVSKAQSDAKSTYEQLSGYVNDGLKAIEEAAAQCDEKEKEKVEIILNYEEQIATKNAEILDAKTVIADCESQIASAESELRVSQEKLASYSNALASIPTAPLGEEDPYAAKRAQLNAVISELQSAIPQKEAEIADKKTQRDNAKEQLATYENELAVLQSSENEDKQKADEARELLSDDLKTAFEQYDNYKAQIDTEMDNAQANIESAQNTLNEIESEIITKNNKSASNIASASGNIFSDGREAYKWTDYTGETTLPYGILAPENLDDSQKVPVMVFLHGLGEIGNNETRAARAYIEQNFNNYELDAFNGLIVCPQSPDCWDGQAANIDEILNDVASKYNIDPDNIVISGHNRGGSGVIETLDSDVFKDGVGFEFKSGVCFAGYPQWTVDQNPDTQEEKTFDLAAPIYVYGDDATIESEFDENVTNVAQWIDCKGAQHSTLAYEAFREDEDGNGRADIFEKLFGTQE